MIAFLLLTTHLLVPIGKASSISSKEERFAKPSFEHIITSKQVFQDILELEDGSKWVVAPLDVYRVVGWEPSDTVVLTPHTSLFSSYKFQFSLNNLTRQTSVRVNLSSHLCNYQAKSRWVVSINKFGNRLFLNDGTSWKIHSDDTASFQEWDINDFITYGKNDRFLDSMPFLIINARLNSYVRAIEF